MGEKITLKRDDLEEVIRSALRLGSQAFGVKHKRLVQGIMEEVEEKALPAVFWKPMKFDVSAEDLELIMPTAGSVVTAGTCHGGCGIEDCPGYGPDKVGDEFVSFEEASRRQAVARATMAELELAERQGTLISIEEADRRVAEERKNAPKVDLLETDDFRHAVSISLPEGHSWIMTTDKHGIGQLEKALGRRT